MLSENAKKLIKYWFDLGIKEGDWDDGTKFFYFYLCLNIVMGNLSEENSDRKMINWVKREESILSKAFKRRSQYLPFIKEIENLKKQCPIADSRLNSNKEKTIIDIKNMEQILEVIYLIRCNFFHGNKPPSIERNRKIIGPATYILKYWLEALRIKF